MKEKRLLRSMGDIDNELILEADSARFRPRRWGHWVALAACVALVISVPVLLLRNPPAEQAPSKGSVPTLEKPAQTESPWSGDLQGLSLGGLQLGMVKEEAAALLGEPASIKDGENIWLYEGLTLAFFSFNGQLGKLLAQEPCGLTLHNGIGFGSSAQQVAAAFPDGYEMAGNPDEEKVDTWVLVEQDAHSLQIGLLNGLVSRIILQDHANPLLDALTVSEISIHAASSEGWLRLKAVDKAAKRICTILTISDPEPADRPEGPPMDWMDFGSGTAVGLYDGDYAIVYRYTGTFDPDRTQDLQSHLEGVFPGLSDAFRSALRDPTETWTDQSESAEEPCDLPVVYFNQISRYHTALTEQWTEDRYYEEGLSPMAAYYTMEGDPLDNVGYGLLDLDNDGQQELVIGAILNADRDPAVFEIWTMGEEGPELLAQSGSRNRYYLQYHPTEQIWSVSNEAENGAANHAVHSMDLKNGQLEVVIGVVFDALTDPEQPWYLTEDNDWDVTNDTPITEAQAESLLSDNRALYAAYSYIPYRQFR